MYPTLRIIKYIDNLIALCYTEIMKYLTIVIESMIIGLLAFLALILLQYITPSSIGCHLGPLAKPLGYYCYNLTN